MAREKKPLKPKEQPAVILEYAPRQIPTKKIPLGKKGAAKALAIGIGAVGLTEAGVRTSQWMVNRQTQKHQNRFRQAASNAWTAMQFGAVSMPQASSALTPFAQKSRHWQWIQNNANRLNAKPFKAAYGTATLGTGTALGSWLVRKKRKK